MSSATLTSKGQVTLPKSVRDDLHLKPGDTVDLVKMAQGYLLRPRTVSADQIAGLFRQDGQAIASMQDMDEAIGAAVIQRDERSRAGD